MNDNATKLQYVDTNGVCVALDVIVGNRLISNGDKSSAVAVYYVDDLGDASTRIFLRKIVS